MTIRSRLDAVGRRLPPPKLEPCECPGPPGAFVLRFRAPPKVLRPQDVCGACGGYKCYCLVLLPPPGYVASKGGEGK